MLPRLYPALLRPAHLLLAAAVMTASVATLAAAAPAAAETAAMTPREELYSDYYRAVAAYERCRHGTLSEADHAAIARYVERQGAGEIGTRRLMLIEQAKEDIREAGCDSLLAASALSRFDGELAPLMP